MDKDEIIFVAGHRGMVGSALVRRLERDGFSRIVTRTRQELDLRDSDAVNAFFETVRPSVVIDAAARVGGIKANYDFPVEFLMENLEIQNNVISAAARYGTRKLLFLGSSCIYPKFAPQPMTESVLLTGALEPTNEPYALAKICGIKLCQAYRREYGKNFISAMPTNLYGPNDNFDLASSHVMPALIRKAHEAKLAGDKEFVLWGSGTARREFLYVDDLADASVFLLEHYDGDEIINVGCGEDMTIRELAEIVCEVVGFEGSLELDPSKPDGTPRKLLDMSKLFGLGWRPSVPLREGVRKAYEWYLSSIKESHV